MRTEGLHGCKVLVEETAVSATSMRTSGLHGCKVLVEETADSATSMRTKGLHGCKVLAEEKKGLTILFGGRRINLYFAIVE